MVIGPLVTAKALLSAKLKHTIQTNWAIKNTRPDSINIEMRGVKFGIPRPCVCWTARDALAILNTNRPVNMAFTARDTEKDSMPMGVNQLGRFSTICCPCTAISPISTNDAASAWVSKRTVCSNFSSTYSGIWMLEWKEQLRQPIFGSTPPNSGISDWESERKIRGSFEVYDVPEPPEQWHRRKHKLSWYLSSYAILEECLLVPSPCGLCALNHRQG